MNFEIITGQCPNQMVDFIHAQNQQRSGNIGYCAESKEQLQIDVQELLSQACGYMVACIDQNVLAGLVAFDVDGEHNNAEVWGPFVASPYADSYAQITNALLEKARLQNLQARELRFFPNRDNTRLIAYLDGIGACFRGFHTTYRIEQSAYIDPPHANPSSKEGVVCPIPLSRYQEWIALHDAIFPHTYYSGNAIIDRLNDQNQIHVVVVDDTIVGYVYTELDDVTNRGSIEFLGVAEHERKRGYGALLLGEALRSLFHKQHAACVALCVSSTNDIATSLYQKVGFRVAKEYRYYTVST